MTHTRLRLFVLATSALALTEMGHPLLGAVPVSEAFPGLTAFHLHDDFGSGPCTLYFRPSLAIGKPRRPGDESDASRRPVITTRLRPGGPSVDIYFDPGPSYDPSYLVVPAGSPIDAKAQDPEITANVLIVPGNGFLYLAGKTNRPFDMRRKYRLDDKGQLQEVAQPFYGVALETTTRSEVTLTASPEGGDNVASIPAGEPVSVLVNSGDSYLIRTRFGLVGWVVVPPGSQAPAIVGLEYSGD